MKEDFTYSKTNFRTPLFIILGFNFFTLLLFVTAPFNWDFSVILLTALYIAFNLICISIGYGIGVRIGLKSLSRNALFLNNINKLIIFFFFFFYSITFLIKYAYLTRYTIFDISGMITHLSLGFIDPQWAYNRSVYDVRPHTISWSVFIVISIINQVFFIFGFLSWSKLNSLYRVLFIVYLTLEIFYWLGIATGFGIISLITTFLITFLLRKRNLKLNFRTILVSISLLTCSVFFYGKLKAERAGGRDLNLSSFNFVDAPVNQFHFIFSIIPESMTQTYMHTVAYLTQGYYHMSMIADAPFNSTFFMGNNPAVTNIAKVAGVDMWERTYIHWLDINKGVDEFGKWHSAYVWFANDVSFFGVPVVLFILAVIVGSSYVLAKVKSDFMSMLVFVMTSSILFYLFANNTYLYNVFYSYALLLPVWVLTRTIRVVF